MRTTKAMLQAENDVLRKENLSLIERMATREAEKRHLEAHLTNMMSFLSNFVELPQAACSVTEALTHMLTDMRQTYIKGR